MKNLQQGFAKVWIVIAIIVIIIVGVSIYFYVKNNYIPVGQTPEESILPQLLSVIPSRANPGDEINVMGRNLIGTVTLSLSSVEPSGKETYYLTLWTGEPLKNSNITFTLPLTTKKGNYILYAEVPFMGKQPCDTGPIHCNSIIKSTFVKINFTVI